MQVDVKKIMALKKDGLGIWDIAAKMHMDMAEVDRVISEHIEIEKEEAGLLSPSTSDGKGSGVIIALPSEKFEEIWKEAASIGAKEALKAFERERKKEYSNRADRRLRNTKLLLRNYHMLKKHVENSVFGRIQMEESAADILESMMSMYDNEVIIDSIKRSASRTAIIVSHIEVMLGLYESYCEKSASREVDKRRFGVLWNRYMAEHPLDVKEIAQKYNMSKENVYSDLNVATERVSALIFGVDGLAIKK